MLAIPENAGDDTPLLDGFTFHLDLQIRTLPELLEIIV